MYIGERDEIKERRRIYFARARGDATCIPPLSDTLLKLLKRRGNFMSEVARVVPREAAGYPRAAGYNYFASNINLA